MTEEIREELPEWSDEAVAKSFRAEIHARFEAHNAAYREREAAELAQVLRDHPEKRGQPGYEGARDSGAWGFYQRCEIRTDRNVVTIVAPEASIDMDLVHLFDNTTVAWSRPWVKAALVGGEPRITIEIILVATWDDSLDAAWRRDGNDRRQVLVELFEDEVRALADERPHAACNCGDYTPEERPCTFCAGMPLRAVLPKIRDRLKLALEHLP